MNSFIHITVISGSDWCTVQFLRVISNCDGVYGVQVSADSAFFDWNFLEHICSCSIVAELLALILHIYMSSI